MPLTITCECLLAVPPPFWLPPLGSLPGFPPTDTPSSRTPQAQPFQNQKGLISPPGMQRGPQTQVPTWPRRPAPRAEESAPLSTLSCACPPSASHTEGAEKPTRAGSPGGAPGGQGARRAGPPALLICSSMWGEGRECLHSTKFVQFESSVPAHPLPPPGGVCTNPSSPIS